jgi:hypothetical protein
MRNNETGEFELVVGDRQLLSAFFIVVLLCAVAFAMGYVVGQNAPRSGKVTAESTPSAPPSNNAADARPQPLPPAPAPQSPPTADSPKADNTPQPTTQPSQGSEPVKPASPASAPATTAASSASNGLVEREDLPPGNFWQVMAVGQQTAEMFRTTLTDHGFKVILSPAPKGLIRVLVGPYPDTQSLGKAKTDLENAGMNPVRFKP